MYYIGNSKIHGRGVFLNKNLKRDSPIDIGIGFTFFIFPYVTSNFGSYINHSNRPNTYLKYSNGSYYVTTLRDLDKNVELTLDYRDTPWYISKPEPNWK